MRDALHELVQAGLGDLDGHPERIGAGDLEADNLGRPWAPGRKRRDRGRSVVMATSNAGSGATVSCEGNGMGEDKVANGHCQAAHRVYTVGVRQLGQLVREALVGKMVTNLQRRQGRPYVGSHLPTQHVNAIAQRRRASGDKNTADQLEHIAQLMRDGDHVAARRMLDDIEAQLDAIGDESGAMDARVFRTSVGGRVRMKDL